jgi:hypothetical protein
MTVGAGGPGGGGNGKGGTPNGPGNKGDCECGMHVGGESCPGAGDENGDGVCDGYLRHGAEQFRYGRPFTEPGFTGWAPMLRFMEMGFCPADLSGTLPE